MGRATGFKLFRFLSAFAVPLSPAPLRRSRRARPPSQVHEARALLSGLAVRAAPSAGGEWAAIVSHASGADTLGGDAVQSICDAAWSPAFAAAEAASGEVAAASPGGDVKLAESVQLLGLCWIGMCRGAGGFARGESPPPPLVPLPRLRERFSQLLSPLCAALRRCLAQLAVSTPPPTQKSLGAATGGSAGTAAAATLAAGEDVTEGRVDAIWQSLHNMLTLLLQSLDAFSCLHPSHRGPLLSPPAAAPPSEMPTADAAGEETELSCGDWRAAAVAAQRVVYEVAMRALPRWARTGSTQGGAKGSRRSLHYAICALCKLWLAGGTVAACAARSHSRDLLPYTDGLCTGTGTSGVAEALVLLQRCWGLLGREAVAARSLEVAPAPGAAARGKGSKRFRQEPRHEAPLAQQISSVTLAWLRWPEAMLACPQLPEETWRVARPTKPSAPVVCAIDERIGGLIAEAAAGMGVISASVAEPEPAAEESSWQPLEGSAREEADAIASALSDAFRLANSEAVEFEDRPVPGAAGWSIRWKARKAGASKGDSYLTTPQGRRYDSIRAAKRFLGLEAPRGDEGASGRAAKLAPKAAAPAAAKKTAKASRPNAPNVATRSSLAPSQVEYQLVDVPLRVAATALGGDGSGAGRGGGGADREAGMQSVGVGVRQLLDSCIELLFGGIIDGGGGGAKQHPPIKVVDFASCPPREAELLLQYFLMQCPPGTLGGGIVGGGGVRSQKERQRRRRLRDHLRRFLPPELASGEGEGRWEALALRALAPALASGADDGGALQGVLALLPAPLAPPSTSTSGSAGQTEVWLLGSHLCAALASLEASVGESEHLEEVCNRSLQRVERGAIAGATCAAAERWVRFTHPTTVTASMITHDTSSQCHSCRRPPPHPLHPRHPPPLPPPPHLN